MDHVFKLYNRLDDNFEGIRQKFKEHVIEKGTELITNKRNVLENLSKIDNKKYLHDSNVLFQNNSIQLNCLFRIQILF